MLNLTQHIATEDQLAAGVVEPTPGAKAAIKAALTFPDCPSKEQVLAAAKRLAEIAKAQKAKTVMIGGAPWFMAPLERALRAAGVEPVYAFSARESVDVKQPDGSVRKTAVFRHAGFLPAIR